MNVLNYYVITDGLSFVCSDGDGKYTISTDESKAIVLTKSKAEQVLNNHIPKINRKKFYLLSVNINSEDNTKIITRVELSDDLNEWLNKIDFMYQTVDNAINRKELLANEHTIVEKEITDLEHYIEFTKFNACTGYKATAMLQERLIQRRKIKDELFALGQIIGNSPSLTEIDNMKKSIKGLDSRLYQPRVLQELFNS